MSPEMSGHLLFVPLSIVACSFLSGLLGGGGGTILLGVLLLFVDVPTAMIVFAVAQGTSNVSRALVLRKHIDWRIVLRIAPGALLAASILAYLALVPNKAFIYLALGLFPLLSRYLPTTTLPSLTGRSGPPICGFVTTFFQLMAGSAGVILDSWFQKSSLDRFQRVATKAAMLSCMQAIRISYFGTAAVAIPIGIPWWMYLCAAGLAVVGTGIAAPVLQRITEENFQRLSRYMISAIAISFVSRGFWILLRSPS